MPTASTRPSIGARVNHLVLNVRDIDRAHRFYTEILGFEHCGTLEPARAVMRFYRGSPTQHHDLALVEIPGGATLPEPDRWSMMAKSVGLNHIAIAYSDRDSWLSQLAHMQANSIEFIVRGNHGMTHSAYVADPDGHGIEVLYELPAEVWEGDVNAALSYFEPLPATGPESLADDVDYHRFVKA